MVFGDHQPYGRHSSRSSGIDGLHTHAIPGPFLLMALEMGDSGMRADAWSAETLSGD